MKDPLGIYLLTGVGLFAIVLAAIGVRTGTAMTFYRHRRADHPTIFWAGTVFQAGLGLACVIMAIVMAFE